MKSIFELSVFEKGTRKLLRYKRFKNNEDLQEEIEYLKSIKEFMDAEMESNIKRVV